MQQALDSVTSVHVVRNTQARGPYNILDDPENTMNVSREVRAQWGNR